MSLLLKTLALMALAVSAGTSSAEERYYGFVKDPYYLGKGGETVGLSAFADDPSKYVRSFAAYKGLKEHFEKVVGKPLLDEEFRELLRSEDVRLVKCVGRINTAGVTDKGEFGWHERACYKNEYLIEVRVPGGWMIAASQGCYNPVEGVRPPPPAPTPVAGACGSNATRFAYTVTGWPAGGNFCAAGEQSPSSIAFPSAGGSVEWVCKGLYGGADRSCKGEVEAPPKQAEAPRLTKRCFWVPTGTTARQSVTTVPNLNPLFANTCGLSTYVPGLAGGNYAGGVNQSSGFKQLCVDVKEND